MTTSLLNVDDLKALRQTAEMASDGDQDAVALFYNDISPEVVAQIIDSFLEVTREYAILIADLLGPPN